MSATPELSAPTLLPGIAWDPDDFSARVAEAMDTIDARTAPRLHSMLAEATAAGVGRTSTAPITPYAQLMMAAVIDHHLDGNEDFKRTMKELAGDGGGAFAVEVTSVADLFDELRAS